MASSAFETASCDLEAGKSSPKLSSDSGSDLCDMVAATAEDAVPVVRTGNSLTAFALVITAVIGAGVLSLPYSVAMLGYPGGVAALLVFSWATLYTSQLLVDVNEVKGQRMRSYTQCVQAILGHRSMVALAVLQQSNLVLTALAYSITASYALQAVANSICEYQNVSADQCFNTYWIWAAIFGAFQLVPSFLPNLDTAWWPAVVGALMSFGYSFIAFGRAVAEGNTLGTAGGITGISASQKVFGCFNSLGALLFAYSFSMILPEIQDTIDDKQAGGGHITAMKRTVNWAVGVMTCFYTAVAIAGYAALGNDVAGNVLNSFVSPRWLVDVANIFVIVHMVPAYQVWSQPFFFYVEDNLPRWWPSRPAAFRGWTLRLWMRPLYVFLVALLSCCIPFFSYIIGLVGAIGFWPTTVYFPIRMWQRMFDPTPRRRFWMEVVNWGCAVVTLCALVGAVQSIVDAWTTFTFFQ